MAVGLDHRRHAVEGLGTLGHGAPARGQWAGASEECRRPRHRRPWRWGAQAYLMPSLTGASFRLQLLRTHCPRLGSGNLLKIGASQGHGAELLRLQGAPAEEDHLASESGGRRSPQRGRFFPLRAFLSCSRAPPPAFFWFLFFPPFLSSTGDWLRPSPAPFASPHSS